MAGTYCTRQGDTWDYIAFQVYGSEKYADFLMENNYPHLDTLVFSAGTILNAPALPEEIIGELPPWRVRAETGEEEADPYDDYNDEEEE